MKTHPTEKETWLSDRSLILGKIGGTFVIFIPIVLFWLGIVNTFFFVLLMLFFGFYVLILWKSQPTAYTASYIRFRQEKITYKEVVNFWMFGVNDTTYFVFKVKQANGKGKYKVTWIGPQALGILTLILIVLGKKKLEKNMHIIEYLIWKSSIPKQRWYSILGKEELKEAVRRIKEEQARS